MDEDSRIAMRPGRYNEHCEIQYAAVLAALHLLPDYSDRDNIVVVDYGCAQGANSIEPLEKILQTLPAGATASLIFEDTPYNDFASLSRTVAGHFSAPARRDITVLPSMVPLGFFRQVVPRAHADLGVSWSSFNYLEAPPAVALDAAAPPAEFAAARHQAFSEAGHHALVKLLRLRANEIRPGGHLVAAIAGHRPDDAEGEPPSTPGIQPLQAALMRMVGEGQLTIPELMRTALFHSHERTPREMHAALADEAVAPLWELEVLEPRLIEHPAWAIYQDAIREDPSRKNEALRTYARAVFDNMVAASGWFWADVLRKSRGDNWDADAFLQEVTDKAVEECVDKFADMKVQIWYNNIRLKRTDKAV